MGACFCGCVCVSVSVSVCMRAWKRVDDMTRVCDMTHLCAGQPSPVSQYLYLTCVSMFMSMSVFASVSV